MCTVARNQDIFIIKLHRVATTGFQLGLTNRTNHAVTYRERTERGSKRERDDKITKGKIVSTRKISSTKAFEFGLLQARIRITPSTFLFSVTSHYYVSIRSVPASWCNDSKPTRLLKPLKHPQWVKTHLVDHRSSAGPGGRHAWASCLRQQT